ncbi:MAG TPA: hypothetical protein VMF58_16130 [Rhizomicrobium sp.]|nr:hypothetical protein [Rhizomicrobium sp.]
MRVRGLLGLELPHPIMTGSGTISETPRQIESLLEFGAAAVVTKTIYAGSFAGTDEKVRRFAHGAVNSTTFSRRPLLDWLSDLRALATRHNNIVVNIHGPTADALGDLAYAIAAVCPFPFELGISCPTDGSDKALSGSFVCACVREVKRRAARPLSVKLAAGAGAVELALAAEREGADAISMSDTLPAILTLRAPRRPACEGSMGYSGPGIKPLVLHAVHSLREGGLRIPVIGIGGISDEEDVRDYLHLGCVAVQLHTELMLHGAARLARICSGFLATDEEVSAADRPEAKFGAAHALH